jgi:hypothetical protein
MTKNVVLIISKLNRWVACKGERRIAMAMVMAHEKMGWRLWKM